MKQNPLRFSTPGFWPLLALLGLVAGCATSTSQDLGLVEDPETGILLGSTIDRSVSLDSSFFENSRIKVKVRNTSGDAVFDLFGFHKEIETAYAQQGYPPTSKDDYGLLLDINVHHSGQIHEEWTGAGIGAGFFAGKMVGANMPDAGGQVKAVAIGTVLGGLLGRFMKQNTYLIAVHVSCSIFDPPAKREGKSITFSRSTMGDPELDEERQERIGKRKLKQTVGFEVVAYGGGRNVQQSEIAEPVRKRLVRIIKNII
ncbi:MAG: hypothetical protein HQL57_05715 [Magnetococcales bacterium]|nr:hypothetical protein [Magnetococcales bacterium]MBF0156663.1 hypothetical protein [Magnetococcales bacterium]